MFDVLNQLEEDLEVVIIDAVEYLKANFGAIPNPFLDLGKVEGLSGKYVKLVWDDNKVDIELFTIHDQIISVAIKQQRQLLWVLSGVHASPQRISKLHSDDLFGYLLHGFFILSLGGWWVIIECSKLETSTPLSAPLQQWLEKEGVSAA
ncbi:hypothetical protein M9H77_09416 [Catharanthus roseus]|uniref:Uncharacterized protein n=1 Tax=Catharanthus roseus TaxID=4058 RepID=A0ACC0C0K5_CATRO|nr:hypothetical protein M9H77_09416 [Catharanthus roseus]